MAKSISQCDDLPPYTVRYFREQYAKHLNRRVTFHRLKWRNERHNNITLLCLTDNCDLNVMFFFLVTAVTTGDCREYYCIDVNLILKFIG